MNAQQGEQKAMTKRLKVGEAAPDLTLVNGNGQETHLSQIWSQGPTLLTFLRHFG